MREPKILQQPFSFTTGQQYFGGALTVDSTSYTAILNPDFMSSTF
jgi:hypothetical protein